MEDNKVNVKIYGQEYVIAGKKGREQIVQVAAYVDNKMHEIANAVSSCSVSDLAVLSAVNIADEHFESQEEVVELKKLNVQLEKDAQHYVQLWDEAKKTYVQYKEETQDVLQQKEDLARQLSDKEREIQEMRNAEERAEAELRRSAQETLAKAEEKCKELENSFFDLQMENLQLKKAVETYKRNME